jgi:hypothetical protein
LPSKTVKRPLRVVDVIPSIDQRGWIPSRQRSHLAPYGSGTRKDQLGVGRFGFTEGGASARSTAALSGGRPPVTGQGVHWPVVDEDISV